MVSNARLGALEILRQDLRFALRTLARNPAFTAVAVLTLALGIGMNAAIFSVVNGVLLRPLPFTQPDRLVRISQVETKTNIPGTVSAVNLDDWRARRKSLADLGGYFYREGFSGTDLTGLGEPQRVSAAFITPGFWPTLGVPPLVGRLQRDDEMVRGSDDHVVVISHDYWRRQFGGDRSIVGRRVTLGGSSYEIVGVTPPGFHFPGPGAEMFIPYSTIPDHAIPRLRSVRILEVVGRMKPGVTVAQATADMNQITRGLAEQYPDNQGLEGAAVVPLREAIVGKVQSSLYVLMGAVGFVLLMAAVNLASLMLARATTRQREMAIRVALGAERGRIIRQLFTESLVLAAAGGILGVAIARFGGALLVRMAAGQLPRAEDVSIDWRVLLFTLAISLITGVAFGLMPALRASSPELQQSLREGARGSTIGSGGLRSALVIAEVALAMILVVGAGLMTRSFVNLMHVELGFAPEHRIAFNYSISTERHPTPPEMKETYSEILDAVRKVPGVEAAGAVRDLPFHGDGENISFMPRGMSGVPNDQRPQATLMFASDGFFNAMGIPLVAGRDLSPQDRDKAPLAFVINQALAKKYFPGQNPVGQTLAVDDTTRIPIVGVAGDVRQGAVDESPAPRIYVSAYQIFRARANLVVRTQGDPTAMTKRIEDAIRSVDPKQTITSSYTMSESVGQAVARPRLLMILLGLFGVMGLVLGALGLYGVLAYLVSQRTREIGIRLALGARPRDVLAMVVGRGLTLAAIGVGAGLAAALLLTRLMQGMLYGVSATDPFTFIGVAIVLLGVAAVASWLPAARATRVDPLVALRAE